MTAAPSVLFDLGGVVVGWEPAGAYAGVLPPAEVADFLTRTDFGTWNRAADAGRPFADVEAELLTRFPEDAAAVRAYRQNFDRTLTGLVPGTGAVLAELQQAGVTCAALTNWSAETFPVARQRFGLLRRFTGVLVSGEERLAKPDPAIFRLALERFALDPAGCVFVDDSPANVEAATALGLTGLHFTGAERFRADLEQLGLLGPRAVPDEPVLHLTEDRVWRRALADGAYPWSGRTGTYESEGFVHAGFADQVAGTRARKYADLPDDALVVLELDARTLSVPVVVEDLGAGPFPHLYGPLPVDEVVAVHPYGGADGNTSRRVGPPFTTRA
ncbi:2-haloacid dehalogenase [Friedmanniella luteola]|uniref:2-haloacid dehalogenase n=1 Tax=Friedmanniella luteola TaxID=546871 RepID=A0A1H1UHE3_9ACTN|nr:HAD-IA family hydrolase [Friedmanniella luteola]SDS71964.1 2-haloacid dehalogenase [Friedmanniella luteola]